MADSRGVDTRTEHVAVADAVLAFRLFVQSLGGEAISRGTTANISTGNHELFRLIVVPSK